MLTIGLTGGIASGKSEVARLLAAKGARIIDADRVVHDLYAPGGAAVEPVTAAFGAGVLGQDGGIDRAKLGAAVFRDPDQMRRLTDIVWPLARTEVASVKRELEREGVALLVIEAPLLIEAGWRDMVDQVWLVRAGEDAARERLIGRRGLTAAEAEARLGARAAPSAYEANLIIENEGDLGALARAVEEAWLTLVSRKLV